MIPPNLKTQIIQAPASTKTRLIFTWDICQKTYSKRKLLSSKQSKKNKKQIENFSESDLDFIISQLKKSKYYDPEMKNCKSYLKITGLILLVIMISLISTLVCLVLPGDLDLESFVIFGISSSFMIIVVLFVLGWFFLIADEELMVNREIEFKKIIENLNLNKFFGKQLLWRCGKFGAFLSVEKVNFGELDDEEMKMTLPTFDNVYDDGMCYYYVQVTDKPYCGPKSQYNPLKRVRKGVYRFLRRWKKNFDD